MGVSIRLADAIGAQRNDYEYFYEGVWRRVEDDCDGKELVTATKLEFIHNTVIVYWPDNDRVTVIKAEGLRVT